MTVIPFTSSEEVNAKLDEEIQDRERARQLERQADFAIAMLDLERRIAGEIASPEQDDDSIV